jgi:type II secretory pathway predicted ATPase ExeA
VGAGKSTLVAHLMKKIDPDQMSVGQIVTSNLDGEELVHVAAQAFGLDVDGHDKAAALGAIEAFLHDEARAGRRCLLIVDESQNLSVEALEELRMLSNFQLGAHPLLQTLLLGQPEFKQVLANHQSLEQLRQRVIAAHHLEAMEPGEIQRYVEHRLRCVGWDGHPAIDQRVYAEMHEATGGIPRRINQVMNRLLLLGAVEQRSRLDGAMLSSVLGEMRSDSTFPKAAPQPMPKLEPAPAPGPIKHAAFETAQAVRIEDMLAERDSRIAELQQAVEEIVDQPAAPGVDHREEIAALEARVAEQEKTLRHVLTMLIEWIEDEEQRRAA